MNSKLRRASYAGVGVASALLLAAQLQHLWWSTVRVENRSGQPLGDVAIVLEKSGGTRRIDLGRLKADTARFVRLPNMGEANLSLELTGSKTLEDDCRIYVEGDMYHIRVTVLPGPRVQCEYGRVLLTRKPMLFEMLF